MRRRKKNLKSFSPEKKKRGREKGKKEKDRRGVGGFFGRESVGRRGQSQATKWEVKTMQSLIYSAQLLVMLSVACSQDGGVGTTRGGDFRLLDIRRSPIRHWSRAGSRVRGLHGSEVDGGGPRFKEDSQATCRGEADSSKSMKRHRPQVRVYFTLATLNII